MKTALVEELSLKLATMVQKERDITRQLEAIKAQKAKTLRQIAAASGADGNGNGNGSPTDKTRVLEALRHRAQEILRPFEISKQTGIKPNAVSVYLGELVSAGLVKRVSTGRYQAMLAGQCGSLGELRGGLP